MRPVLCSFVSTSGKGVFPLRAATANTISTGGIPCQRRVPRLVAWAEHTTRRHASSASGQGGEGSPWLRTSTPAESMSGGEPGDLDGPILADFLAMGAGQRTVPPTLAESQAVPGATLQHQQAARSEVSQEEPDESDDEDTQEILVRERPLVVAALQRSEALAQVQLDRPARAPVRPPRRSPGQVPEIFTEAHAGYAARCEGESLGENTSGSASSSSSKPGFRAGDEERSRSGLRNLQIRVRPWHRTHMQKLLCRAVMFHFLQELREVLGLRSEQHPLCFWEARYAWEQLEKGQVVELCKYLAETELHIERGPERRKMAPGTRVGAEETQKVRAERRLLAREWSVRRRNLEEDAVLRVFLDGQLCWSRIRNLLVGSSSLAVGETSGSPASCTM